MADTRIVFTELEMSMLRVAIAGVWRDHTKAYLDLEVQGGIVIDEELKAQHEETARAYQALYKKLCEEGETV